MDKRLSNLRIKFPKGWKDISIENPNGPPTFVNGKDGIRTQMHRSPVILWGFIGLHGFSAKALTTFKSLNECNYILQIGDELTKILNQK